MLNPITNDTIRRVTPAERLSFSSVSILLIIRFKMQHYLNGIDKISFIGSVYMGIELKVVLTNKNKSLKTLSEFLFPWLM